MKVKNDWKAFFFLFKSLASMFTFHWQDMYNAFKFRILDMARKNTELLAFSNVRLEGGIKILKKRVKDGRQRKATS